MPPSDGFPRGKQTKGFSRLPDITQGSSSVLINKNFCPSASLWHTPSTHFVVSTGESLREEATRRATRHLVKSFNVRPPDACRRTSSCRQMYNRFKVVCFSLIL